MTTATRTMECKTMMTGELLKTDAMIGNILDRPNGMTDQGVANLLTRRSQIRAELNRRHDAK